MQGTDSFLACTLDTVVSELEAISLTHCLFTNLKCLYDYTRN